MNSRLVSAVFDTRGEAERAVNDLRSAGVKDSAISIVARQQVRQPRPRSRYQ